MLYTTGNQACDTLREIAFTGNIIPQIWYKVFVKRDLKNPKPHLLAINVLADIVYWYRPSEVRDECTGAVIGYRKKFGGDMLQRNYAQIAEQFGCSAGQAKDAIVFLEQMGVLRREFRTIESGGINYNNIMFIDLDAKRLQELTYPSDPCAEISPEGCRNLDIPSAEISPEVCRNFDTPVPKFHRYTENTTENTTEISEEKSVCLTDRRVREETEFSDVADTEALVRKIRDRGDIPTMGLKQTRMLVRWLCDYEWHLENSQDSNQLRGYQLFTECLCSMMTAPADSTYSGDTVTAEDVRDAVQRFAPHFTCGELDGFMRRVVDIFYDALDNHNVKKVKSYMKSIIWNAFTEDCMNCSEYEWMAS